MKLAAHYTKTSIITSLLVLVAGAVVYFIAINYVAEKQLDKSLTQELYEAKEYVSNSTLPPQRYDADQDHAVFTPTDQSAIKRRFFDTTYHNSWDRTVEPGRAVEDLVKVNSKNYKVTITMSREGTEFLVEIITIITLALIAGLLAVLFITNKYLLKGLWQPFFDTLGQIKGFDIEKKNLKLKSNDVDEFSELNEAINGMAARISTDYQNLKQFSENASHELMTPLAVVTTKLDTLIQDEQLTADQLQRIQDVYTSINKSVKLNQTLLLLVKLDNELIANKEPIDLKACIAEKIQQFNELAAGKGVVIHQQLENKTLEASRYLLDILLNNLLSNAIRHNSTGGEVKVYLTSNELIVSNMGPDNPIPPDKVFERFHKGTASNGTGLGLALVKNIAQQFGLPISYSFSRGWHTFTVKF
ncbi:HAMP domain-containing histidine kinase [Mucilaginibacter sp. 21P]|uniref:sensor histidine kinase n=1 Tax=Mucilaginibacter sp. 21P TaxID=2778902 RepID=UPI001C57D27B|nr:HAMP domain-containing sensor histidine kinase [Mucilaginibacter sp. 21P]QXV65629.1 HAMP domain-containing histidine kinase [Mucilaginibacter sp. 21P]